MGARSNRQAPAPDRTEILKIDDPAIGFELIAEVAQPLKPLIEIEKTRALSIGISIPSDPARESQQA